MALIGVLGRTDHMPFLRDVVSPALGGRHDVILWKERDATPPGLLAELDILIVSGARCDRYLLGQTRRLRAIVSPTIGIDGISLEDATEFGIMVVNAQVAENAESMAEATICSCWPAFTI